MSSSETDSDQEVDPENDVESLLALADHDHPRTPPAPCSAMFLRVLVKPEIGVEIICYCYMTPLRGQASPHARHPQRRRWICRLRSRKCRLTCRDFLG